MTIAAASAIAFLGLTIATGGSAPCYSAPGVEYLKPAHYKELKGIENATACCAACGSASPGR